MVQSELLLEENWRTVEERRNDECTVKKFLEGNLWTVEEEKRVSVQSKNSWKEIYGL